MAFNFGAFAGGAATSALSTYTQLNADRMRQLQTQEMMQDMAEKNAFQESVKNQAAINTPKGGMDAGQAFDKGVQYENPEAQAAVKAQMGNLTPEQQQAVFQKLKGTTVDVAAQKSALPAVDEAAATQIPAEAIPEKAGLDLGKVQVYQDKEGKTLATTEGEKRSPENIMRSVMDDMYKSGNMAGYQKAAGIYKMAREVSMSDATDKIMEDARAKEEKFQDTLDKHGMVGAVEKLGEEFAKNGIKLSVVKGKDGKDAVAVMGQDGKPQQTFTSSAQVMEAFSNMMGEHTGRQLLKIPGHNPKDVFAMMKDKAQGKYYDVKSMLDQALQPYQIEHLKAQTNASNASAGRAKETTQSKVNDYAQTLVESNAINPKTNAPFTNLAEAKTYAAGIVLRDPNAKPERSNPYMEKVDDYADMLVKTGEVNPATKKPFTDAEARKYAAGVVLKDPAQAQASKQLTKPQEIAYNKALDRITGNETPEQLRALAKTYNLPLEVFGVGPNPIVTAFANAGANGEKEPSKSGQKQPPPAAINTGLPKGAEDIGQQIDAVKSGLAALRTTTPGPKAQRSNPEALQLWQAEKTKLESQLKELTKQYNAAIPTGINQRATYR